MRSRDHDNVDVVMKLGRTVSSSLDAYVELARKTRAPSYQEAFLWLPMQSTGGLADGRSYVGNPDLNSEVSREISIGTDWHRSQGWFGPQLFYKNIDNYIQGAPTTNMTAKMVANMMTGLPALEFTNTQAEIYGVDISWGFALTSSVSVQGVLTWVRGRRTDIDDNLYRLAPLNGSVSLVFDKPDWTGRLEMIAFDEQDQVAAFNDESSTAGYGLLNARIHWHASPRIDLFANIENVLNREYAAHLSGINRVMAADIAIGNRLFGVERNLEFGFGYQW